MSPQRGSIGVAADLYDDAVAACVRHGWSAAQHSTIGRVWGAWSTARRPALDGVRAGTRAWADLTPSERDAVNTVVDLDIDQAAEAVALGSHQLAHGHPVVALDDAGALVGHRPDGSREHSDPAR